MRLNAGGESRKYRRRPVELPAWIETPSNEPLPCRLHNISPEGAQLAVSPDWALPQRFVLRLTADGKLRRGCRLIWHKDGRIGVRFLALPEQKPVLVIPAEPEVESPSLAQDPQGN